MSWIKQEELEKRPVLTKEEGLKALDGACGQVLRGLSQFTERFPRAYSEHGFYPPTENVDWTTGFWTGEVWLAYERTGDQRFLEAAKVQMESFLNRIKNRSEVETHDLGFLYSPSCVAGWKLAKSPVGREAALLAAEELLTRFHPKGEFIQAWGSLTDPGNYRLIIDSLLNLPLLYWASEETGEERFRDIAQRHIHTTLLNVIRPDCSTWHTFFFNRETGAPDHGATCQGYRDGSAWARGQAWGIYGTALGFRYTKNPEYIRLFEGVTEYFLGHLPKDLIPYWDLEFGDGDEGQPRDSSSASIAACGMMEMAEHVGKEKGEALKETAGRLLKAVADTCAVKDLALSNGLVLHSTYSNHSPYNTCNHYGVDECNIWGDYFFMEGLTRFVSRWEPFW